jgi:thiol-disulfide isomerase/thioredoxin
VRRLLAPVLALALTAVLGAAVAGCGDDTTSGAGGSTAAGGIPTAPDLVGRPLPDIAITRLDSGAPVRLTDLRGTPAVVNLWFSTCEPCKQEMPAFESVHQSLGGRVRFVGLDTGEAASPATRFLAEQVHVTYEQWHDPDAAVATELRIPSFPATLFVSPDGRLVRARYGAQSADQLRSTLQELFGT